jgi:hypothetical protein
MALKKAIIVWQFRIFPAWPERRVAQGAAFAGAKDALVRNSSQTVRKPEKRAEIRLAQT